MATEGLALCLTRGRAFLTTFGFPVMSLAFFWIFEGLFATLTLLVDLHPMKVQTVQSTSFWHLVDILCIQKRQEEAFYKSFTLKENIMTFQEIHPNVKPATG